MKSINTIDASKQQISMASISDYRLIYASKTGPYKEGVQKSIKCYTNLDAAMSEREDSFNYDSASTYDSFTPSEDESTGDFSPLPEIDSTHATIIILGSISLEVPILFTPQFSSIMLRREAVSPAAASDGLLGETRKSHQI